MQTLSEKVLITSPCLPDPACTVTTVLHEFAESLGNAVDAKDQHTRMHSEEVAEVAHTISLEMRLAPGQADIIHVAGHLHDIGKIGVPDSILFKKTKLTNAEWREIRKHPAKGAEIVKPVRALVKTGVADIILHHHERFDGQGYPHRLAGQNIPLGARIVAVADSLSAMLQHRPYRPALSLREAMDEITACSGSQFDPDVVKATLRGLPAIKGILNLLHGTRTALTNS